MFWGDHGSEDHGNRPPKKNNHLTKGAKNL